MGKQYPVNGHLYSFTSIELKIADFAYLGIGAVNYNESVESVAIYGSDPVRIGRTLGKRKLTSDVEMQRREWDILLRQLGGSFARKRLHLTVQYGEVGQPVLTDSIEGWITEVDSSNQEGTDPSAVKLTIDPMDIRWGATGLTAGVATSASAEDGIGGLSDGSFWLRNTAGIEGPTYAPNPWDTVSLGGEYLPGICKVSGLPMLAFDKKKAGGVDGATITVNGYLPGPIEIEVMLWTEQQWIVLQQIANAPGTRIWRRPNKGKNNPSGLALVIGNKALDIWTIFNVVVLGVSVPQDGPLPSTKIVKIKCVEYVPTEAAPKTTTAKGSKATVPDAPELTPVSNKVPPPPEQTDIHPCGPAQSRVGGVS